MCESIYELRTALQGLLEKLDPKSLDKEQANDLFEEFVLIERLGAAGKSLAGLQAADTKAWWSHRSPAHYMADKTRCSVNHAAYLLNAVEDMQHLPETEKAFRRGALTEMQAIEVVSAALMDGASEQYLLEVAELESMPRLHEQASRVRAAAMSAEQKHQRAHKQRELRHWTDVEGVFRLAARLTPQAGAVVMASIQPFLQEITRQAAKDKVKERAAAHLADALVEMAERSRCTGPDAMRPGPGAVVHVRLDYAAIERGYLERGEICEVPGIGPIPLQAARQFLGDSYRVAVLMDGEDIRSVKGLGHSIPKRLRRAVYERDDFRCVVPGCSTDYCGHEIDHVIPVEKGGETKLYNLALLCRWHHGLKTHHGHRLQHYRHRWIWLGPNDPPPQPCLLEPEPETEDFVDDFMKRANEFLGCG